jgi:glyceraldehyde-3-phosphate dehydrogenase/erythrose-4-phosphate dehydrogenase
MPDVFELVHLNDIASADSIAYLIKFDSIHGTWGPSVEVEGDEIVISEGDRTVRIAVTQLSDHTQVRLQNFSSQIAVSLTHP